jgi:PEP-CTERM motif
MARRESVRHLNGRLVSIRRLTATQLLGAMAAACVLAGSASASGVKYNPAPTTGTGWKKCSGAIYPALANDFCATTAFFGTMSLTTNNPGDFSRLFGAAFNAWNNNNNKSTNPAATTKQMWTLAFGSDPGGTLNVSVATALQGPSDPALPGRVLGAGVGGAKIQVTPNAALLQTLNDAVANDNEDAPVGKQDYKITWVQGVYDNFVFPPATVPAYYEMDVDDYVANKAGQDPSYCASFSKGCPAAPGPDTFLDTPALRYFPLGKTQAFFIGNAYIAIESVDNKSLIVYDGVDYGWHNYVSATANAAVPEPATWALMLAGFGGLGVAGLRRGRARLEPRL